ncbi:hypothetical protein IJI69_03640 [Candidatus Saccharibacteria bacterium]|nr:hypothetical protein [Candidatus Saccharibacteria bacterium]
MIKKFNEVKVLFSLPEKEYLISNTSVKLTPALVSVKSDRVPRNDDPIIGLSLGPINFKPSGRFWELYQRPLKATQAYRALLLSAECPRIEDDTLCACFYVMSKTLDETVAHYLTSLKSAGFTNVEEAREKILAEKIDEASFIASFVGPLTKLGIPIDEDDLPET